ncbi:MAG TPA: response regulator [Anaerolineae bacterium]|nr:response regulator [Anaerolineae bacterium]HQI86218.1 response regulator [Anaerolineae bacterium]
MTEIDVHKTNILVVDDNPANLRLLAGILSEQGYAVRPARSGHTALSAVRLALPDLILLDIMMPDIDGYTVCEQLKADGRTRDIPVIFISALHETIDKVRAFALGAVDFITKPFHADEVLARVRTHVALRAAQRQLEDQNTRLEWANNELAREVAERLKVETALRQYADEQAALYAVTAAASVLDPEALLSTTLDVVLSLLDSESGWVILPGDTPDAPPRLATWRGVPEAAVQAQQMASFQVCSVCRPLLTGEEDRVVLAALDECGGAFVRDGEGCRHTSPD